MLERISLASLAGLNLLALAFAPWLTLHRETGARGALLLLPDRFVDFTGDSIPLSHEALSTVLWLSVVSLLLIAVSSLFASRWRYVGWFLAGVTLLVVTFWGWQVMQPQIYEARMTSVLGIANDALAKPSRRTDVAAVEALLAQPPASVDALRQQLINSGVRVRGVPYSNSSLSLAAFLSIVTGLLACLFALRLLPSFSRLLNRVLPRVAVPAAAIFLALLAAAVVILGLQSTPVGRGVTIDSPLMYLVGRLDTLFFAYQSLFSQSLGTLGGFLDALKFATPLIFTGLAVAFSFRVGLFNIGAPGQMILGAIFAMLAGVYLPGPRVIVLPLAILAAALGGGLWGALPGWLKARFGANEVINTILLNYIAYSLMLFLLTKSHSFALPAARILMAMAIGVAVLVVLAFIPFTRQRMVKQADVSRWLGLGLMLLVMVVAGLPRASDFITPESVTAENTVETTAEGQLSAAPKELKKVTLELPFRVEGLDPKSQPLREQARLRHLPSILGVKSNKDNVVTINYALLLASVVALLALWLLPLSWYWRITLALLVMLLSYVGATLLGWHQVATAVPPTQLNAAFLIALACAVLMQVLMWRSKWGYELRAVGLAPKAAEYGGASIRNNIVLAMAISGAFAGLTATHYVLGGTLEDYALRQTLPTSDGFDGIAVALLGYNTPLGVVLAAFLFGVLKNGGLALNIAFSELTRDVVNMILALVVLFIAARGFLPERLLETAPLEQALLEEEKEDETEDETKERKEAQS